MGGAIEPRRKNTVIDLPLLKALGCFFACIVASLIFQLTTHGLVRHAAGIVIGVAGMWLIPLQYGGRRYSLRDDRRMTATVLASRSLSDDEIPEHPAWWREGGEPYRRSIRVAVWFAVGLSLAAVLSYVAAPTLLSGAASTEGGQSSSASLLEVVWAACWISPFLILWNIRSARREKFRLRVEETLRKSQLESIRDRRRTLQVDVEAYEGRLKGLRESSNATLHLAIKDIDLAIKDLEQQGRGDRASSRLRDVVLTVGGLVAGFVLSIVGHRAGLT